jgi:integrase
MAMRPNKYGVAHFKGVRLERGLVYFWQPPLALQKSGSFHQTTLGTHFGQAIAKACELNMELASYGFISNMRRRGLNTVRPSTVGCLFREFQASSKFARYATRTRHDYSTIYRGLETTLLRGEVMFGDINVAEVSRQLAYSVYEQYLCAHGHGSTNKAITACRAAFKYGCLRFKEITTNPFSQLDTFNPPPRRQRWTSQQLRSFVEMAERLGYQSIGRCALMCMELVQRPGDILDLKWSAFDAQQRAWYIRQSKKGAVVRVPETRRLKTALNPIRQGAKPGGAAENSLVCSTATGKRWHRRNFAKAVRRIARAAGLPDDLQIRDLRRNAATEAASAGATTLELMAVGGWANQASIRPYLVQTVEQAAAVQRKRDRYRERQERNFHNVSGAAGSVGS